MRFLFLLLIPIVFIILFVLIVVFYNGYSEYTTVSLTMNDNFKILQISDIQIKKMDQRCSDLSSEQEKWPCDARNTTAFIQRLIDKENPNFVVFGGDNVVGFTHAQLEPILKNIFTPVVKSNISFSVILGNHDKETNNVNLKKMLSFIKNFPNVQVGNIHVLLKDQNNSLLYQSFMFDYPYETFKIFNKFWLPEQINWFNKNIKDAPTLVFGHLPLDIYHDANIILGDKFEDIYSVHGERKLWDAFKGKQIISYSAGHDHINDYCARVEGTSPLLCYSGGAGYTTYGKVGWPRRARVFTLNRTHATTYKVLDDANMTSKHFQYIKI